MGAESSIPPRASMKKLKPCRKKNGGQSELPNHPTNAHRTGVTKPQDKLVEILLVFAKQHFRNPETICRASVTYRKKPLFEPLLPRLDPELDYMALDCFQALLSFMGDHQILPNMEVHFVHRILQMCRESHKPHALQQEVYCQILKQITHNKSTRRDGCFRGWQLLYIMTAYFPCEEPLLSTVHHYLKTVVRCGSDSLAVLARACYQQLRRSANIGGRACYPSAMEVKALLVGHGQRWIFVNLPGAPRQSLKVHMSTTVSDATQSLCQRLGITVKEHMEEYGLSWGDCAERLQSPARSSLYILDLLQDLESQKGTTQALWFYRTSWAEPLVLTNRLCVDMQYQQVLSLYEAGQLLMRREHAPISQAELASRLAALKHRASGTCHPPNRCELRDSIPADMWLAYDEDYWMQKVLLYQDQLLEKRLSVTEAKETFLDIASSFPLFGTMLLLLANIQHGEVHMQPSEAKTGTPGTAAEISWACLPEPVLVHIYSLLQFPEKYSMSLTCKAWSLVFRSPATWRKLSIRAELGSVRPWIRLLSRFGDLIESVRILVNEETEHGRMQMLSLIEHLAHLRRSKLKSLALVGGEGSDSFFEALQESLKILFDRRPATSVGLTEVDLMRLPGRLEDTILISLAINNPSLEKLLIANRPPACRLQPRSLLTILGSCRRLSHLAVWGSSLTDDVAMVFLQARRAPLQFLEIHYEKSTTGTEIISNHMWKKLREKIPSLRVRLYFSMDMDPSLILDVLQPGVPVVSLHICPNSGLSMVLSHITEHYHHCIKNLTVHGLETPEEVAATRLIQQRCSELREITYCGNT